jgi:integral membrane sensor domain MASE1
MTNKLDSKDRSEGDREKSHAYQREFWPGILAYAVVLVGVLVWGDLDGDSPWRFLWAVLPVIPALWIVRAVLRHVRRIDDYQRLLLLQALGGGFAVAMIASVTLAFLEIAGLSVPGVGWIIYGAGMLGWIVSGAVVGRR